MKGPKASSWYLGCFVSAGLRKDAPRKVTRTSLYFPTSLGTLTNALVVFSDIRNLQHNDSILRNQGPGPLDRQPSLFDGQGNRGRFADGASIPQRTVRGTRRMTCSTRSWCGGFPRNRSSS